MAFPLYLSVVWLLWVLGGLSSRHGMALALVGLTLIGFALWLWSWRGATAALLRYAAMAGALALLATPPLREPDSISLSAVADRPSAHERYSEQRLSELRAQGRTVFVNFTADWCITCKLNERVALDSDAVHQAFAAGDVAWLEGDWTRSDPAITRVLTQFGHPGVPLYLLYLKGGEPKLLPQVLTPQIVIDSLKAA
jgi:thiol:disulfide interchange protein DsbD